MNETIATYRINPAEDVILFGDEITDGMWVLAEAPMLRSPRGDSEDAKIRAQRFRRVTRLRREAGYGAAPEKVAFVGEWVDGYQEVHRYAVTNGWLVRRETTNPEPGENRT